jgi:DNA modification methylase
MRQVDWKQKMEDGITTNALWITSRQIKSIFEIPDREIFKDYESSTFHGIFIPEIPYQFIKRFAENDGWIWDPFAGNDTTYYVAKKLGVQDRVIRSDINPLNAGILAGDAEFFNPLPYTNNNKLRLVFVHPPYWNRIIYSDKEGDLSNCKTLEQFYEKIGRIARNIYKYVEEGGYVILVCGNIWLDGEEIDLGVNVKEKFREVGFKCRSHIIKDYGEIPSSGKDHNLWYYRNLKNDTNFFYGDNIFILKKMDGDE